MSADLSHSLAQLVDEITWIVGILGAFWLFSVLFGDTD